LRLIGSFISGKDASKTDDDGAAMLGREWSDAELTALGNMRVRGLPTEGNRGQDGAGAPPRYRRYSA